MDKPLEDLRILLLEDVPSDAELEEAELRDAGLAFRALRVDTRMAFEQALDEFKPDIILADYRLPNYNGREALEYVRRTHPYIPCIMVTGALGDEAAVELLKLGARDYILKDSLARLAPAIQRTMSEEMGIRNRKLAEDKYKALFSEAMDGILLVDCGSWQVVDCNAEFEKQSGRTLEELKCLEVWQLVPPAQAEPVRQGLLEIQRSGSGRSSEFRLQRPGGETVPIEFTAKFLSIQGQNFIQSVVRDIGERLRAEQALRESEARYRRITEGLTDYQYTVRIENGRAVETIQSPACVKVTGYTAEEFAANTYLWLQMIVPEDRELVQGRILQVFSGKDVSPVEHRIIRKDGELRWVSDTIIVFRDAYGKLLSYDGVIRDITERIRADLALRESEEKFHSITASAQDAILMVDNDGNIAYWNAAAEKTFGYSPEEAMGRELHLLLAPKRYHDDYQRGFSHFRSSGEGPVIGKTIELAATRKDGTEFPIELSLSAARRNEQWNAIGIIRDISERKHAEEALRRANRALQTLSAGNMVLVQATTEAELLARATNVIVDKGGYRLAVVDFANDDPEKSVLPVAWSGMDKNGYWAKDITWADTERGQLPMSKAIRKGITQVCRDIESEAGFDPWREAIRARGYVSNIALPLSGGGRIFGCLSIYSPEKETFDEEEVRLLEELSNDLAYGIISLRAHVEREQHARLLRQSLEQSIQTIAGTVEARDPYTAGHQRRVAQLATAIASEMALPEEQVNGIHLAAIIHDLGKIHIPAEILVKPGRLTETEFLLVKTHPQSGYDILKDVSFPWPIADIVLQHHEKLDGSGYPSGLKGEQILLESRIMTVADVVEAMSSHRPYRPALGVDAALQEIRSGRGSIYDPAVVDVCLRLFAERGFKFSA